MANIKQLKWIGDDRGKLVEIIRRDDEMMAGKEKLGQVYVIAIKPGETRAKHYHLEQTEYFSAVKGKTLFYFSDEKIELNADDPKAIEVLPKQGHAIKNVGDEEAIIVIYTTEPYNHENPDEVPWEPPV